MSLSWLSFIIFIIIGWSGHQKITQVHVSSVVPGQVWHWIIVPDTREVKAQGKLKEK